MLSKSAERLYWLARYLERTENIAQLVNVHMNLLMDLPKGVELGWQQLIRINAAEKDFYKKYSRPDERNVTHYLLSDSSYHGSLFSSLTYARENIRTSRELLPDEAWEQVNEMYLYAKKNLGRVESRRARVLFLSEILEGCQRFTGLLSGYMSHNNPYRFIRLGRNLERADMTSRILDSASLLLAESRSNELRQYETMLWINILQSLNALLMYRRNVRNRIAGDDVLTYLLKDKSLPRSVACCVVEIAESINHLPNNDYLPVKVEALQKYVQGIKIKEATQQQLHSILDDLQNKLAELHSQISDNWFLTAPV